LRHGATIAFAQELSVVKNCRSLARLAGAVALLGVAWPVQADAQYRYPRPYPGPSGYRLAEPESNLRLEVTPRDAMVYVDGYLAGAVDEFDGLFQRLHVTPGEHELTLYLAGYRTIHERLYLSPNATRKITHTMEKLGPGEAAEAPPTPPEPQLETSPLPRPRDRYPFPGRDGPPSDPRRPDNQPPGPAPVQSTSSAATIVLRVQPSGADVTIDGEHWQGPSGDERLVVQVAEGRHRVEVRKDGYRPFSTEVDVKRSESLPVNVSLTRD
jgi:hypothetical protein